MESSPRDTGSKDINSGPYLFVDDIWRKGKARQQASREQSVPGH